MSEYIEFEVNDLNRFESLRKVFFEIKKDKDADSPRPETEWRTLFDDEALSHFDFLSDDEHTERKQRPIAITPPEHSTQRRWDFLSMIDAFFNGEYALQTCEIRDGNIGRLDFFSYSYPYGGVGCIVALIEAYGFRIVGIQDGTGYVTFK